MTLYLLVENMSNAKRESFFEKELPFLRQKFKRILIYPLYPDEIQPHPGDGIEVRRFDLFSPGNRIKLMLSHFWLVLKVFGFELRHSHDKMFYLRNFGQLLNILLLRINGAKKFETEIKADASSAVFYTYWFNQWTFTLSVLKEKYPHLKIVTRVHGGDYDEDQVKRTLPFRYYQLSKVNRIFPVSDFARRYLSSRFRLPFQKMEVARLGLPYAHPMSPVDGSVLHLVSCSAVIELKRIHLIAEILSHITVPVKWTHFGDGPLMNEVKQKVGSLKLSKFCEFKGYVPNGEFLSYLQSTAISLVINVSESEGIPVSLMEAISFGIPVAGPDVCGVPELVTEDTGLLIPLLFNPQAIALSIEEMHLNGMLYDPGYRKGIQTFYKRTFYAPMNYKVLADKLSTV